MLPINSRKYELESLMPMATNTRRNKLHKSMLAKWCKYLFVNVSYIKKRSFNPNWWYLLNDKNEKTLIDDIYTHYLNVFNYSVWFWLTNGRINALNLCWDNRLLILNRHTETQTLYGRSRDYCNCRFVRMYHICMCDGCRPIIFMMRSVRTVFVQSNVNTWLWHHVIISIIQNDLI